MSLIVTQSGKVRLGIGSFALFRKTFTEADIRAFAKFIGDEDPVHFKKEAFKELGFEKTFVYGMMPTSLFTKLYLATFISPVYLSQTVNFKAPVFMDEEIEVKFTVQSMEITRANKIKCTVESTVLKVEKNEIAVTGTGLLLLKAETVEIIK